MGKFKMFLLLHDWLGDDQISDFVKGLLNTWHFARAFLQLIRPLGPFKCNQCDGEGTDHHGDEELRGCLHGQSLVAEFTEELKE